MPILEEAGVPGSNLPGTMRWIEGISDKPVYLLIQDGKAEIKDASFLWGKGAIEIRES